MTTNVSIPPVRRGEERRHCDNCSPFPDAFNSLIKTRDDLPRQARDKREEKLIKRGAFHAGTPAPAPKAGVYKGADMATLEHREYRDTVTKVHLLY